jgi:uncharacterized surface protein with fasciclin (FAS1) repeats
MKRPNHNRNQLPRRLPLRSAVAAVILGLGAQAAAAPDPASDTDAARQSEAYSSPAERNVASDKSAASADVRSPDSSNRNEVLDAVASQYESLSKFVDALQKAGMGDALSKSNYTLFAPTNEAFESVSGKSLEDLTKAENREELLSLLRAHLVADDMDEDMAKSISQARTIDGGTIDLTRQDGKLQIGDATVVESSFREGTLRVYPIDKVLTPNTDRTVASAEDRSSNDAGAAESRFQELDRNQDGYLSESELSEEGDLSDRFADGTLDSNDDGRVSRSEFAAFEGIDSGAAENDDESPRRDDEQPQP